VRGLYRTLQAEFQSLQERYEEMCRQLREHEMQHPQQEHVKQEHGGGYDAEIQQPRPLQAGRRQRDNVARTSVKVETGDDYDAVISDEIVSDEHVKQEELADENTGGGEVGEGDDRDGSYDDEDTDEDGSDSEEEHVGDRPAKRYVRVIS
jgi:hypothetical protein